MEPKPFPVIHTDRLVLREIKPVDAQDILFLRSNETVTKFIQRPEHRRTRNLEDAAKFIKEIREEFSTKKSIPWGITFKDDPELIGSICLWNFSASRDKAEIGYDLKPGFFKKGIMSEALKVVINYAFQDLNFTRLEAFTHKDNQASKNLLLRNGFKLAEERKDPENPFNLIYELNAGKEPGIAAT